MPAALLREFALTPPAAAETATTEGEAMIEILLSVNQNSPIGPLSGLNAATDGLRGSLSRFLFASTARFKAICQNSG